MFQFTIFIFIIKVHNLTQFIMEISYETTVSSAESWRLVVNETETFFPDDGKIKFTRTFNASPVKFLYIVSAFNGTEIGIAYICKDSTGKSLDDKDKKSIFKKTVQSSNRTQTTLNIPLS